MLLWKKPRHDRRHRKYLTAKLLEIGSFLISTQINDGCNIDCKAGALDEHRTWCFLTSLSFDCVFFSGKAGRPIQPSVCRYSTEASRRIVFQVNETAHRMEREADVLSAQETYQVGQSKGTHWGNSRRVSRRRGAVWRRVPGKSRVSKLGDGDVCSEGSNVLLAIAKSRWARLNVVNWDSKLALRA